MLSTHAGERTSAHQTGFRPDLLPSGLYRRPRSFTGSWGLQAFYALSADCTGYLSLSSCLPVRFPGLPCAGSSASDHPSRALPPIGNWKGAHSSPSLTLPRRSGTYTESNLSTPCAYFSRDLMSTYR